MLANRPIVLPGLLLALAGAAGAQTVRHEPSGATLTLTPADAVGVTAPPLRTPSASRPPALLGDAAYFFAGGEIVSSPKPVNLVDDPRPAIVFGTSLGQVWIVTADGVAAPGWPVSSGSQVGYSSAAVADLDGDGAEDVLVHANNALEARDQAGSPLAGWPRTLDGPVTGNSMIGSPLIADLDGDGDLEVLVGHFTGMFAFHHDGTPLAGWPIAQGHLFGPLFSTPAVADLDGDGDAEICFKIYGGNGDPADVHLLHHDGTAVPGWPKLGLDRSHLASPAFADVDGDGAPDVLVPLHFFDAGNFVRLYAWRADGSDVPGFPVVGNWNTVPENQSVGDVDGDGSPELFVSTFNGTAPHYAVHAWNHDGTPLAGSWPHPAPFCLANGSPALADVDGGGPEVIVGVGGCLVDDEGAVNVWAADGTAPGGWPQFTPDFLRSSPLVIDADGDGGPEIYIGSSDGWIYRFVTGGAAAAGAGPAGAGAPATWNQIFHDARNTNAWPGPPGPPADLNGDGVVNVEDLILLITSWGPCPVPCPPSCPADLDGDCAVAVDDLVLLILRWS